MITTEDQILNYYKRSREITLRDYFAGQALHWLLMTHGLDADFRVAYEIADAMLKARAESRQ